MKKILGFLFLLLLLGTGCVSDLPTDISPTYTQQDSAIETLIEIQDSEAVPTLEEKSTTTYPVTAPTYAPRGTYENVDGNTVPRPYAAPSKPSGASAKCRDGTYSFSENRRGTCSGHDGVATWY